MLAQVATYEVLQQVRENQERWLAYYAARNAANAAGLPLLNIGCPRVVPLKYPCGDVCLDIDPWHLAHCQSERPTLGDVRDIPFPAGHFGAVLCSHVLEHLDSVEDAERALAEMRRVSAGKVFVVSPGRFSVAAWLHLGHRLWIEQLPDGGYRVTKREPPLWRSQWTQLATR